MSDQPVCEYCGDEGTARFEGFSVCTDCNYRLRQTTYASAKRRKREDDANWDFVLDNEGPPDS